MSRRERSSSKNRLDRTSTADGSADLYDHAINLVDATTPSEGPSEGPSRTESPSWRQLARNATQTSVKDQLARRKYAKWRQERYDSKDGSAATPENESAVNGKDSQTEQPRGRRVEHVEHTDSAAVDFGHLPKSPEATQANSKKKKHEHHHKSIKEKHKEESVVDILYENQRGSFFCGIPLYSHSSLLQFDPAAWVNKDYHASAVNITNAQVPDPSWQWAWKHWYVDMSNDVDEDGWQYSFAFFGNFSWHGTHPWFHSFCRRRRWLRMRTKIPQPNPGQLLPSSMSAAHRLNTDYFTIHSKREPSPSLNDGGPKTARPETYASYESIMTADEAPEEINDIASLLKALRMASVDRQKVDAVRQFVELGGEELAYLKDRIPEIMQFLVFQNSKRQVLEFLRQTAREAQQHREEHNAENRPEGEAESRRINNLLKAVEAADEQVKGLEYWSDRKHVLQTTEHTKSLTDNPLATIFDKQEDPEHKVEDSPAGEIKGIAKAAGIGTERVRETTYRGATLAPAREKDKGKGKEQDTDDQENDPEDSARLPQRLERDQIAIPDGEEEGQDDEDDVSKDLSKLQF